MEVDEEHDTEQCKENERKLLVAQYGGNNKTVNGKKSNIEARRIVFRKSAVARNVNRERTKISSIRVRF